MFPNYADVGYWEYLYAEGDIGTIETASADITGVGMVTALSSRIILNSGSISGTGTIVAMPYKIGEEWVEIPAESNTWL